MNNPFTLKGQTILISGASSGIGEATAIVCDQLGATLLLLGRNEVRLEEVKSKLSLGAHKSLVVDLSDFEVLEQVLKPFLESSGAIHGLVNAAGVTSTFPFKLFKPEKLDGLLKINVHAAFYLSKLMLKKMSKSGGSIVFISSIMATHGEKAKTLYAISKGAVSAGVKSMAIELAAKGIRVNSVAPGIVNTPMTASATYKKNEELLKSTLSKYPLGFGEPEDVANACAYLLSDASRWVTGTEMVLDGGYTAQ
jgi:NAD(P)-dependent dehydrogenase (short-subunit alcohol dehydrogenase family)